MKRLISSIFLLLAFAFAGIITNAFANTVKITTKCGDHGDIIPAWDPGHYIPINDPFELNVYPAPGYAIDYMLVDNNPYSFNPTNPAYVNPSVKSDLTIEVYFKSTVPRFDINSNAGPNGKIDPSGKRTYNEGDKPCYQLLPDDGYEIEELIVDATPVTPIVNPYCFDSLTEDHSIVVTFKAKPDTFEIEVTIAHYAEDPDDPGVIIPSTSTSYVTPASPIKVVGGSNQLVGFHPENAWIVDTVIVNGTIKTLPAKSDPARNEHLFENVTSNQKLYVAFFNDYVSIPTIEIPSLAISPNPVNGTATITKDADVNFTRIDVVDMRGNVVLNIENPTNTINFSNLTKGSYIVRFHTAKGFATRSIVKN